MLNLSITENLMADGFAALDFTADVEAQTSKIWDKVKNHVTPMEWRLHAPLIAQINRLKREKNAVILAHNYMTTEIFHGVGDFVGDSLALAREAAKCDAAIIVQAGVHFMAETSKVLAPDKRVLIPDLLAGCSLASSITGSDVRMIKARYPGAEILAHPECPAEILEESDFAGSTAAMNDYVIQRKPKQVILITECSMAGNVEADAPDTDFIKPCNLCPHMKRITLQNIHDALVFDRYEVTVDPAIASAARLAVQRMIDLPPPLIPARYDLVKARHHVDVELI